ncbi:hypothetical protein KY084_12510 [Stakelama sp. CBK3Z-3]|uniref:Uncharacterized protein n=1 Tax=Stakelama flava TaxID=2860338 RepID=A0ABS6XNA0_9SPHN|nr:hypothetical protein [Stakelama flava]MBW4331692.1 hypothetical protein [Stakelama flava]
MSRGPDAATLLERALLRSAAEAGCDPALIGADWERWASVTFTGARHTITLSLCTDEAGRDWLVALPDADFPLSGHLVADLAIDHVHFEGERKIVRLQALTVEDR